MTDPDPTTLDRIRKLLTAELGKLGAAQLEPHAELDLHLKFDALDRTRIAMAIEDEFAIEVPDELIERAVTIKHLVMIAAGTFAPAAS